MKLIPILIIIGMLSIPLALAQPPVPSPVKVIVEVNGHKLSYDGTMTNLFTREIVNINVVEGVMLSDLSRFKLGYAPAQRGYAGDRIELKVCDISSKCTFSFYIENTLPHEFNVIIQDPSIVLPPILQTCPDEVSKVVDMRDCPVKCADNTFVKDSNECLENKEQILGYTKTQLGVTAGISAGFAALIVYWVYKRKQRARGKKMIDTRIAKLKK